MSLHRRLRDSAFRSFDTREVRAPRIYEGTSQIQRGIIARAVLRAAGDVNG